MIVFLDFEASGLGKHGFPIEVGWAAEDGTEEKHLIRPAPGWEEWEESAETIHGISRDRLEREGEPHDAVAKRMVEVLTGHDLYASAPSWDGQWLSRLLRAAGQPRHALRLRDTEEARQVAALSAMRQAGLNPAEHSGLLVSLLGTLTREAEDGTPAHRALDDARRELALWREAKRRTEAAIAGLNT
ncbi:3'-5' exonuclease [Pararoseomonas indoligenes]|uniref:Transcriptional regulator n=1 Tax=Roseomonas indoligenes TaxID=2820811 RepID=A0A940S416_9PROT|nr:transcriptional regulator [Pararoseomonas indoligenes]MBP0492821.1 transcriptional regulator [Pararoseomonas indoligenes]